LEKENTTLQALEILKQHFGHSAFRPFQKEAVEASLGGQDLLMILPTGGGKSICYQLPALMKRGVTIIVSPLLALMHDQVQALKLQNISAEMIGSSQSLSEQNMVFDALRRGELKLLYVAPERFANEYFINILQNIDIASFVIDEAHCVSEWGHEFREDYRNLGLLRENFPNVPISAFTATATKEVASDIVKALRLRNPLQLLGSVYRQNLEISAKPRIGDGVAQIVQFVKEFEGESGIVYAFTRADTERIAEKLKAKGIKALAYHAGMSQERKNNAYKAFMFDEVQVMVATIAFGMGIDKSNIRFVIHATMPRTLENYYQEIGRAGRDGLNSKTMLLYSGQDMAKRVSLLEQLQEGRYKQLAFDKLEKMVSFCQSESCRHQQLANYFSQELAPCEEHCDNCNAGDIEKTDITKEAQMFLSAIYRTNQNFGKAFLVDILRGSKSQKIEQFNAQNLSVYGIGKEHSKQYWDVIIDRLLEKNAIKRGEHRNLLLTQVGIAILKGKEKLNIRADRLILKPPKEERVQKAKVASDLEYNQDLFEALRKLRYELSQEENVPAYIIFGDKTLYHMASLVPITKEEMLEVNGVGEVKFERYGEKFLEVLANWKN